MRHPYREPTPPEPARRSARAYLQTMLALGALALFIVALLYRPGHLSPTLTGLWIAGCVLMAPEVVLQLIDRVRGRHR